MKRALIFPGQGVQTVGMGKDFYEKYKSSREVFDKIKEDPRIQIDIKDNCFSDFMDKVPIDDNTQLSIIATELSIFHALLEEGIQYDTVAGLSLGEFAALYASGGLSLEDTCWLVSKRGRLMQKFGDPNSGMDVVMGASKDELLEVCRRYSSENKRVLTIANYNCPDQMVISGHLNALEEAEADLKNKGYTVAPLPVAGAFHNQLMADANWAFIKNLNEVKFMTPQIPYVANVTGDFVTTDYVAFDMTKLHMVSSVSWQGSIEKMIEAGVEEFIEVGPKHTLTSMIRKINPNVKAVSISTVKDLDKYLGRL